MAISPATTASSFVPTKAGEVGSFSDTVHMHEENMQVVPEEMVVKRGDFDAVIQEGRHDRIHLYLEQHQVAHHQIAVVCRFGQGNPATETKRRGCGDSLDRHLQIVAWDIDLQYASLEVPLAIQSFEDVLIVAWQVLCESVLTGTQGTNAHEQDQHSFLYETKHVTNLLVFDSKTEKLGLLLFD